MIGYRLEAMIGLNKVGEAIEYTTKYQQQFIANAEFLFWRGRLLIYNSNLEKGKQYLKEALSMDPDNVNFQRGWKNIQKLEKVKKEGTDAFSVGNYKEAIEKFTECLELDKHNSSYNQTILFNRACAHLKLGQKDAALRDLNTAIDLNDEYVKAIMKRSELYLQLEKYDEAVRDLEKVKSIDPCKPSSNDVKPVCSDGWSEREAEGGEARAEKVQAEGLLQALGGGQGRHRGRDQEGLQARRPQVAPRQALQRRGRIAAECR